MISIETKGRLGNQFFQYATCRSIAEKNGLEYHINIYPIWNHILRFNLPMSTSSSYRRDYNLESDFCTKYLFNNGSLPNDFLNIRDNTFLIGYFQREEFFDYNYSNIKKWFCVDNLIDFSYYNNIFSKYKDFCFIHVRGTDFLDLPYNKKIKEYYDESIKYMKDKYSVKNFVVVTDDLIYSKKLFPDYDLLFNDDYLIDLNLLKNSKYFISSNSTFSWWAGYLNDDYKIITYPFGGLNHGEDTHIFSKCKKFTYL